MKQRIVLIAGINICCLILLLNGRRFFREAQAFTTVDERILIEAVHYDGYSLQDADEAVALRNLGPESVDINGWLLSDGTSQGRIEPGSKLPPFSLIWLAGDAGAFRQQFGFNPDLILETWPGFANDGDEVLLFNEERELVDVLVYGQGDTTIAGWTGSAVQPYTVRGVFGKEGQILFRKPDPISGLPVADSNSASDWAQEIENAYLGRRVRFPGWDLEDFLLPARAGEPASLTISIAPDNALETVLNVINSARESLRITTLTFENLTIAQALVAALNRGVSVRILLEGSPVGGIADQERAICQQVEFAGGECWFMISDQERRIHDRYQFMHAKYMIIDGQQALISSENLSPNSMPDDDKSDGTWGRRGVISITDAAEIVAALDMIFERDLDPANHHDLMRWRADDPRYGAPPAGYVPIQNSGGVTYTVRFPEPVLFDNVHPIELQQAPDNLLRKEDGILGLVDQAGEGDTLLIQQLQERPYWGASTSNRMADPNLRLELFIAAARRGATVRLLLDDFFDDADSPVSNAATCRMLNELAGIEGLSLECRQANPTGLGIHNKMILARIDGRGYIHMGSWNGTELASKGNREVAILAQSDAAYSYLATVFESDWPHDIHLPLLAASFDGYAAHALISEVLYDSYGRDEAEFIEIANPTPGVLDLGGFSIGDAVLREDFEDVRRFPTNTLLAGKEALVVALNAASFFEEYQSWPDFEIIETTPLVPNLIDDASWGDTAALLRLGNQGDEVILRDPSDQVVDVMVYGEGSYPDHPACPLVVSTGHSLERFPYWRDSDNCPLDFRDWPFPNPGTLP